MSSTRSKRPGARSAIGSPVVASELGRGFNKELAQGGKADEVERLQRHVIAGQGAQFVRHRGQGRLLASVDCRGERIERRLALGQQTVDDQELPCEADGRQFAMGARRFAQRGILGAGDENEPGALAVRERLHGGVILGALLFEARERPEAGGVALPCFKEARPGDRQLQQPDGVAGRRGVEDDMVVGRGDCSSVSSAVNSSKAAISVVQAPESCSSMPLTTASGRLPRTGPTIRSR